MTSIFSSEMFSSLINGHIYYFWIQLFSVIQNYVNLGHQHLSRDSHASIYLSRGLFKYSYKLMSGDDWNADH